MTGAASFEACAWPLESRAELTHALAAAAGIGGLGPAERFEVVYATVAPALGSRAVVPAPSVLRAGAGAGVLLAIVGYAGSRVRLLAPGRGIVVHDATELAAWLRAPSEARVGGDIRAAVARAGLAPARAQAVTAALLTAAAGADRLAEGTRLTAAAPSMGGALRAAGGVRFAAGALAGYVVQLALLVGVWSVAGAQAVAGRPASGWTLAGLIGALAAARLASSWAAGRLSIETGAVLRTRVLDGILALDVEPLRAAGIGQLMGRVTDLEAVESLALGGGLAAAAGLFELLTGAVVLALGVAPAAHLAIAGATIAGAAALIARLAPALEGWTSRRLILTHDLVERMAGQRTVVAQLPPASWHQDEARTLRDYSQAGGRLDALASALAVLAPRVWLLGAVAALVPHAGDATRHPGAFVASVGGVLFVAAALRKLAQAVPALGSAAIAWRNLRVLAGPGSASSAADAGPASDGVGRPQNPCWRGASSRSGTRAGRRLFSRGARSWCGQATACWSKAHPAAASRRWRRCWPACASPRPGRCAFAVSSRRWWEPIAGARASGARPNSTRITSFRPVWASTCCWGEPGRPVRKTSPRRKRSAASWIWGPCWRGCRRGWSSSWARAAGSFHTASGDGCSLPAPSCSR
jgi:hypothetical protein